MLLIRELRQADFRIANEAINGKQAKKSRSQSETGSLVKG
jgi:hypothetical protein